MPASQRLRLLRPRVLPLALGSFLIVLLLLSPVDATIPWPHPFTVRITAPYTGLQPYTHALSSNITGCGIASGPNFKFNTTAGSVMFQEFPVIHGSGLPTIGHHCSGSVSMQAGAGFLGPAFTGISGNQTVLAQWTLSWGFIVGGGHVGPVVLWANLYDNTTKSWVLNHSVRALVASNLTTANLLNHSIRIRTSLNSSHVYEAFSWVSAAIKISGTSRVVCGRACGWVPVYGNFWLGFSGPSQILSVRVS